MIRTLLLELSAAISNEMMEKFFFFGSVLTGVCEVADVDILVIYEDEAELACMKQSLCPFESRYPLDLVFMMATEEKQFNFIQNQGATRSDKILYGKALKVDC